MNMVMSILLRFIYPPPSSLFITAMSFISLASQGNAGFMEFKGKHAKYSKFWNVSSQKSFVVSSSDETQKTKLPSRIGMITFYTPSFLAGLASFALFPNGGFRFLLLSSVLTIHFFKRIFEVLFVHKYSGWMGIEAAITISTSYFLATSTMIYSQHLISGLPEPPFDLKYVGIVMFLTGISGNFYHHYLLSKMRAEGEKEYKIPKGGLFNLVICPHYLFEILGFVGVGCISQTLYAFIFSLGTTIYLTGRSYATRKWYLSKFEDFHEDVKALVPYIF